MKSSIVSGLNYVEPKSGILTRKDLEAAMETIRQSHSERVFFTQAKAAADFLEATPASLRSHPFIVNLAYAIGNGAIFHPADAKIIKDEWIRLCREES